MTETCVHVDARCRVKLSEWGYGTPNVVIEYVERSPDPWYGDSETEVDVDEPTAQKIIDLLVRAYPNLIITPTPGASPEETDRE